MIEQSLLKVIRQDISTIPVFINTLIEEHKLCFDILTNNIFPVIKRCGNNIFLSWEEVDMNYTEIISYLIQIQGKCGDDLGSECYRYVLERIQWYETFCNELDLFECSQNFHRLYENLYSLQSLKNIDFNERY